MNELRTPEGGVLITPEHVERWLPAIEVCGFDEAVAQIDGAQPPMKRAGIVLAHVFLVPDGVTPEEFRAREHVAVGDLQREVLIHFRDEEGSRRWQLMPSDPFSRDECIELARRHLGARFFRVAAIVLRVLGIPYDDAVLRRLTD